MKSSLKQRLVVMLIFLFVAAIQSSLIFKSFALICYIVAMIIISVAFGLALSLTSPRQRKLAYWLAPLIILICLGGEFLFFRLFH